jgi:hypothetical protein
MTMIQDIESIPELTPGERRAVDAEAAVTEALQAVEAARAAVDAAVAADVAASTTQTRGAAARARNRQAVAQSRLIEAEEAFQRELDRLDDGEVRAESFARQQAMAEVIAIRTAIRTAIIALLAAGPSVSRLRGAQGQASLPQLGADREGELLALLAAGRHLLEGLNQVWPMSSKGEVTR